MDAEMFINATKQIQRILVYALENREIANSMVSVISNIMDVNDTVFEEGDKDGTLSQSLVNVVNKYTQSASLPPEGIISINSHNLAVETKLIHSYDKLPHQGYHFMPTHHWRKEGQEVNDDNSDDVAGDGAESTVSIPASNEEEVYINIPSEAMNHAKEIFNTFRVHFAYYKNSKLFRPMLISNESNTYQFTKYPVLAAAISNISVNNLKNVLVYGIPNKHGEKAQMCVYWSPELQNWSAVGLSINQTRQRIVCSSKHMTAFSVLLDPTPLELLTEDHQQALTIISFIGSIFSVVGLFLTIITYLLFRCLNRDRSGKILLNLCLSLLLMNVSFLLVALKGEVKTVNMCTIVAILIHYFVLTSFAWMLVEALNMYQLLITVFATTESHFMLKRMLCAWGMPGLVVGATALYDLEFYSSTKNQDCMMSPSRPVVYYLSYLGPTCTILVVNCVVFTLVTRVLCQRRVTGRVRAQSQGGISVIQIRGAFTVMTLLGVTWMFGVFAIGELKLIFQYVFCIANSLQGFIIFMVRCVQYPEARIAWLTLLNSGKMKKYRGAVVTSSQSRHTVTSSIPDQPGRNGSVEQGSGSIWGRFRASNTQPSNFVRTYTRWSFRNVFGTKKFTNCASKSTDQQTSMQGKNQGATEIAGTLNDELKRSLISRPTVTRTQSMREQTSPSDELVSLKRSGSMNSSHQSKATNMLSVNGGNQSSLANKEGEDTSWQFLRPPTDSMVESKVVEQTKAEIPYIEDKSRTPSPIVAQAASRSDQGYISGAATAEHSPESPRQNARKPLIVDPYVRVGEPKNDISIKPKPPIPLASGTVDDVSAHTFVVIDGQKIYTNSASVRFNLQQMLHGKTPEVNVECVDHYPKSSTIDTLPTDTNKPEAQSTSSSYCRSVSSKSLSSSENSTSTDASSTSQADIWNSQHRGHKVSKRIRCDEML